MRGRPKTELVLTEDERGQLTALTLRRKTAQALAPPTATAARRGSHAPATFLAARASAYVTGTTLPVVPAVPVYLFLSRRLTWPMAITVARVRTTCVPCGVSNTSRRGSSP